MSSPIQYIDDRMTVSGNMTLETATALLANGAAERGQGALQIDLSGVADVDSSGLAVLFGWQRAALSRGQSMRILNPPPNLISLAEVYGVSELLPLA